MLTVFEDPPLDGPSNMARDEYLLYADEYAPAALRLYGWSPPTISLGYFQRFDDVRNLPEEVRGLAVVRRSTGGGAILHDREVTYCLTLRDSIPMARTAPVDLYRMVHECWARAVSPDGPHLELAPDSFPFPNPRSGPFFCFEKPGKTDLLLNGGKALGSAQRRASGRVMQHGSFLLGKRFAAHPGAHLGEPPTPVVRAWCDRFVGEVAQALGLDVVRGAWSAAALADIMQRREKFAGDDWNRMR